jgi:hypothetical protein
MPELDRLDFLLGRWKGRSVDQFGEKGIQESTLGCDREPSDKFLRLLGENRKDGALVNRSIEFIAYDSKIKKFLCKRMWSMGFIENGEGDWQDDDTLVFQIKFDNEPEFFAGTFWRSFIRRYGADEIGHGLYTARKGEEYHLYGETREVRLK